MSALAPKEGARDRCNLDDRRDWLRLCECTVVVGCRDRASAHRTVLTEAGLQRAPIRWPGAGAG